MRRPVVGTYIIGQTPRPDLTDGVSKRFPDVDFVVVGALDGTVVSAVPPPRSGGFPLETTLQDGTRVEVDAEVLEPKIQNGPPRAAKPRSMWRLWQALCRMTACVPEAQARSVVHSAMD